MNGDDDGARVVSPPVSSALPVKLQQSSSFRGVSLHKGTMKFRATIKIKGVKIALGSYDSEVEAAKAFDRAALRYRGSRAEVNFAQEYKPPVKRQKTDKAIMKPKPAADIVPRMGLRSKVVKLEPTSSMQTDVEVCLKQEPGSAEEPLQRPAHQKLYSPFSMEPFQKNQMVEVAEALDELEDDCYEACESQESGTAESNSTPGSELRAMASGEADSSHGLSLLKSRFQLYRFDSNTASTCGARDGVNRMESQHSVLQPIHMRSRLADLDRNCSEGYRQMLMSRVYAEQRPEPSMVARPNSGRLSDPSSLTVASLHFEDYALADRREAWWRRQVQLERERDFLYQIGEEEPTHMGQL